MILRLLSQSPVFWIAAAVSATSLVMLTTPFSVIQFPGLMTLVMCPLMWMAHPATPFVAVLPVDARRVLLIRTGMGLLLTCLPVAAWILSGYVFEAPADPVAAILAVAPERRLVALPVAALAVVLPQLIRPGVLPHPGQRQLPLLPLALVAVVSAAAIRWLSPHGAALVLAGIAVAAMTLTWHRMPRSFLLAPTGAEGAGRSLPTDAVAPSVPAAKWWRPAVATVLHGRILFAVLLVGFMGIGDMWLMYAVILLLPEMAGVARQRLRWMHTLPLSRTALLWTTLTPVALTLLAVSLVGGVIGPTLVPGFNALEWGGRPHEYARDHPFDRRTKVPLTYWRIAPSGEAPVVRAPWGETTPTDTISLPGLTLYNPYSARTGSSAELVEWQFGRASTAVYGRPFTLTEYESVAFAAPRRMTRTAPVYLLGGSLALTFVILLAWSIELAHWHSLRTRPVLRYGAGVLTVILAAGVVVLDLFFMFRHGTQFVVPVGAAVALRVAGYLPNIGVVAIVASLPAVAVYSLLHWQIGRSDVAGATRQG